MENLLKHLPSIKTIIRLAAFCAIVVYGFQDMLITTIGMQDSRNLTMLLFFLILLVISVLGIAAFFAISQKEIASEVETNMATLKGVEEGEFKQRGKGNKLDAENVKKTKVEQDSSESDNSNEESKKKTKS